MKRFAALFMVLALVFAVVPSTAFAETTADPAQPATTAPVNEEAEKATDNTNQTDDVQAPENNEQTNNDDQQSGDNQSGDNQSGDNQSGDNKSDNGGTQTGDNGQSGDDKNQSGNDNNKPQQPQPCPAEPSEGDFHEIVVDTQEAGENKVKVIAKLDGKEAEGTWYVGAAPAGTENFVVDEEFPGQKGTTFTYVLDITKLPAGEIDIYVAFEGTIDGKNCSFAIGATGIIVEDEGDTVKENPDKPKKPENPKKGKEAVNQIKGGKLPKTATSYPVSMMFGGLLLAAGVGMLMFRRLSA